ncbi:hypothetical protein [Pseudaestuariivita atlantica]|uniref:hypothetical protein n=1 Tax=Pseudaestuariivita atlantica TaxID=1317121 RepID=UPI00106BB043|nr:hypothetical protein [Pseudaestuariivita atlantica]
MSDFAVYGFLALAFLGVLAFAEVNVTFKKWMRGDTAAVICWKCLIVLILTAILILLVIYG